MINDGEDEIRKIVDTATINVAKIDALLIASIVHAIRGDEIIS